MFKYDRWLEINIKNLWIVLCGTYIVDFFISKRLHVNSKCTNILLLMKTHFQDLPPGVIIRQWYIDHPVDTTRTKKSLCVGIGKILTLVNTLLSTKDKISESKLLQNLYQLQTTNLLSLLKGSILDFWVICCKAINVCVGWGNLINHVRAVGSSNHKHITERLHSIHFSQQLSKYSICN